VVVTYGWWVGGDFMAYGRFLLVATAALAVCSALGLGRAHEILRARIPDRIATAIVATVVIALVVWAARDARARWARDMARPAGWLDGRWEGVATMDRFARVRVAAGEWLAERVPRETLATVGAAGAMPYASRLQIMDVFGLVDPQVASHPDVKPLTGKRSRPGHQLVAPTSYIKSRDPDLLCHVGYAGPRRPGRNQAARGFRRGYDWACVELGSIPDPRAPGGTLDAGFYCCRRPVDRSVGPFGAEATR
jgi:arabinofuranosyltransferase